MKRIIFMIALGMTSMAHAQRTDIGLHLLSDYQRPILLELRTQISEKWKFTSGVTYVKEGRRQISERVMSSTDSTVTSLVYSKYSQYASLSLGLERRFKESIFSIRGDLGATYRQTVSDYDGQIRSANEDEMLNYWPRPISINYDQRPKVTHSYVNPYIGAALHANIPIGNRFLVNLFVGAQYNMTLFINETNKFDPEEQFSSTPESGYFDFAIPAGVGLRYQLGKLN